ncbi:MAG: fibronectin type III domain-containing protein [Myxococcota bacterium]
MKNHLKFTLSLLFIFLLIPSEAFSQHLFQDEKIRGPVDQGPVPPRSWEIPGQKPGPLVTRVKSNSLKSSYSNPHGILYGKSVYLSPGHGWYYTGSGWTTQRGLSYGIVEDLSNAETIDQFLVPCLQKAGAHVVPVRETDVNKSMVIVDNDDLDQAPQRGIYQETGDVGLFHTSSVDGFAYQDSYDSGVNPFSLGTNRLLDTSLTETARFVHTFNVPHSGYFNVYISYSAWQQRAPDAHYIVNHPGGQTHFRVDQRHHGGTWVLLGKFYFMAGQDEDYGSVVLANDSEFAGTDIQVSTDAVRIGGGDGIIARGGSTSGKPRFEECCRYYAQFAGAPVSVYDSSSGDHSDDVSCRSRLAAWIHEEGEDSVYFSYHTNAGGGRGTSTYVYSSNPPDGSYTPGAGTAGSDELAHLVQSRFVDSFDYHFESGWSDRGVRSAYFGELNPAYHDWDVPAALVEALFHDSVADTEYYRQPWSRYIAGRAACHAIIEYFAQKDEITPVLPPDPPVGLRAYTTGYGSVKVEWEPPPPDPVGGDEPQSYNVYYGPSAKAFGNPAHVEDTSFVLTHLQPGQVLYFKVAAVNEGGESLTTAPVAVRVTIQNYAQMLFIDAFNRFDSGLNWLQDLGYADPAHRVLLREINDHREGISRHAPHFATSLVTFDTWQWEAMAVAPPDLNSYVGVNLIMGRGTEEIPSEVISLLSDYVAGGGNLFISGSKVATNLQDTGNSGFLTSVLGLSGFSENNFTSTIIFEPEGIFGGISSASLNDGSVSGYLVSGLENFNTDTGKYHLHYDSGENAGVNNELEFGKVVTWGLPLELVEDPMDRLAIVGNLLDYFQIGPEEGIDGGIDVDIEDPETDSETDIQEDSEACEPDYNCSTEQVVGCHCKSVVGIGGRLFHLRDYRVLFLLLFALYFLIRKLRE